MTRPKLDDVEPLGAYDTPPELCDVIVDRMIEVIPELRGRSTCYERILEPSVGSGNLLRAVLARFPDPFDSPDLEACDVDPFAPGLTAWPDRVQATPYQAGPVVDLSPCARNPRHVLCPTCDAVVVGRGAGLDVPRHKGHDGRPCAGEGRPGFRPPPRPGPCPVRAGFLVAEPIRRPSIILANPPYAVRTPWRPRSPESVAHLHVARALEVTTRHAFVLLRQSWIAPERHRQFVDSGALRAVWTIRPRPPFAWFGETKSTDSGPSALFWFDKEYANPGAAYDPNWCRRYRDGSPRLEAGFLDWRPSGRLEDRVVVDEDVAAGDDLPPEA